MDTPASTPSSLQWHGNIDGHLLLIDQTYLPQEIRQLRCETPETVWEAIRSLRVRGAPAISIAAAYGVCLGAADRKDVGATALIEHCHRVIEYLATSRPTAVNLFWALDRMRRKLDGLTHHDVSEIRESLLLEARSIHDEDRQSCHAIGKYGAPLVPDQATILTHCNTGGLATAEYGTALSVIFTAHELGKKVHVFVNETRPLLQGARLTTWELQQRKIPHTLICDSMAAVVMKQKRVDLVITGADRIAANGDTANKIGTYGLAVLAQAHDIPFYVAAPSSTFDRTLPTGAEIPIEERAATEITHPFGVPIAPPNTPVYNPAFDVTPAHLIRAFITDHGLLNKGQALF